MEHWKELKQLAAARWAAGGGSARAPLPGAAGRLAGSFRSLPPPPGPLGVQVPLWACSRATSHRPLLSWFRYVNLDPARGSRMSRLTNSVSTLCYAEGLTEPFTSDARLTIDVFKHVLTITQSWARSLLIFFCLL